MTEIQNSIGENSYRKDSDSINFDILVTKNTTRNETHLENIPLESKWVFHLDIQTKHF